MLDFGQRSASGSESGLTRPRATLGLLRFGVACAVAVCCLGAAGEAWGYRYGLGTSLGGATLRQGHLLSLSAGFPRVRLGWLGAVHPAIDLGLYLEMDYNHPAELGEPFIGGGGGGVARFALARGRASVAIVVDFSALAFSEGGGAALLLELGSPALELSLRVADRVAIHAAVGANIEYVTAQSQLFGGFEARGGVTIGLTNRWALFATVSYGMTVWSHSPRPSVIELNTNQGATARFEGLIGAELNFGVPSRSRRPRANL